MAAAPGGPATHLRHRHLLNTNYADLSFLFSLHRGSATNPHLRREYLAILETTHRTPFYLNLHHQDVAHTVVLGATGSGKSSLFNALAGAEISAPGVRRPTTGTAHAAVWSENGDDRAALLDWLGVPRRHLVAAPGVALDGLGLTDRPAQGETRLGDRLGAAGPWRKSPAAH